MSARCNFLVASLGCSTVIGASGGTFDVELVDAQESDEALFRTRFPALKGVTVQKALLPAFDRAKAQKWWQEH